MNDLFVTPFLILNASVLANTSSIINLNTSITNLNSLLSNSSSITNLNASVLANTSSLININYPNPNFSNVSIGASGTLFTNSIQSLAVANTVSLFTNTSGIINLGSNNLKIN